MRILHFSDFYLNGEHIVRMMMFLASCGGFRADGEGD